MPNIPDEIEIGYSRRRLLVLFAGGLILTIGGASMAFHWLPDARGLYPTIVGYFCLLFFGFCIAKIAWLFFSVRGPVLFISYYGIRDLRVTKEFIPWDSVEQISLGQIRKQKFVTLKVTPALEKQIVASAAQKMMAGANHFLGVDGIVINPSGLAVDPDTLLEVFNTYYANRKPPGPDRSGPTASSV